MLEDMIYILYEIIKVTYCNANSTNYTVYNDIFNELH